MSVQTLIERLAAGLKLFLPNRSLKYFPPSFTFRRPLPSSIEKQSRRGGEFYLALYRLEFAMLQNEVPSEVWSALHDGARSNLKISSLAWLSEPSIIGLEQFGKTDFIVVGWESSRQEDSTRLPSDWTDKFERLRVDLEDGLKDCVAEWRHTIKVTSTQVKISELGPSKPAEECIQEAYDYALALATKQWTPQMELLRKELETILVKGAVTVLAQPIMNLQSGDIFGWEILARGPKQSVFHMPDELFRFATQSRLLPKLEFQIVKCALEEIAARNIKEPVFLNVTAITLTHPMFLNHVLQCLEHHPGLNPGQIYFEITERHEVSNFQAMSEVLRSFREQGFRFAVDDAGAGYSSLQWIGEMQPELIKIDRSVIQQVDQMAIKESLLKAFVTAAKEMNCVVVAEGVEREEEADVLFRLDVAMGQGYYFARPNALVHEHERDSFLETKQRIQHRRNRLVS